eukprot:1108660_1
MFSCSDSSIFTKWIDILRDLCFGKLLYCGYLRKISQGHKTWRRRYFAIYDTNEMRYFEDDSLAIQKGKIELNKVTKITLSTPNQYHYTQCMELHTPDRVWVLAADTSNDRDVWVKGIQQIITQHNKGMVDRILVNTSRSTTSVISIPIDAPMTSVHQNGLEKPQIADFKHLLLEPDQVL